MSSSNNNSENELMVIHQKLNEQSQELNELRRSLAALHGNGNGHHQPNGSGFLDAAESSSLTDRRGMLKKVAGLAVGVATVGLLQPGRAEATDRKPGFSKTGAPSTTGGNWILGQDNNADAFTGLQNTNAALVSTQLNIRNFSS